MRLTCRGQCRQRLVEGLGQQRVEPLRCGPRSLGRQELAQERCDRAAFGQRRDVARGPLQHRDVCGRSGQRWYERHGSRTAADDDELLACVSEVLGPLLGMDHPSREVVHAGEVGEVAVVVSVVAAAREHEPGCDFERSRRRLRRTSVRWSRASGFRRPPSRRRRLDVRDGCARRSPTRRPCPRCTGGWTVRPRSTSLRPRDGTSSRGCACRSRTGSRGNGRGPRCPRRSSVTRISRSEPRGSASGGSGRRRCPTGRRRRPARRGGHRRSRPAPSVLSSDQPVVHAACPPKIRVLPGFHQLGGPAAGGAGGPFACPPGGRCSITLTLTLDFCE